MDLLIISNYWHFPSEKTSSRYHSIAEMAVKNGIDVEVITSTFYHTKKAHRNTNEKYDCNYKYTLVSEPAYKKNISIKRITAHFSFKNNVINYLKTRKKPDVIYLFVPPTGLGKSVVKYAKRHNIKIVIDILDLWPEAFNMFIPKFLSFMLYPMKKQANYIYKNADNIVAVSKNYLNRAKRLNNNNCNGKAVYIGIDLDVFDNIAKKAPVKSNNYIKLVYIGMLGHSYDLISVMDAINELRKRGFNNLEFIVMGDGPLKEKFEKYAQSMNLPVIFKGRLSYEEMINELINCDIATNVLNKQAAQSIINKHADYLAAGLPIINVQPDMEFNDLLASYKAGIGYSNCSVSDLAKAIKTISTDEQLRNEMKLNSRKLAEEKFNRNFTYQAIIDIITETNNENTSINTNNDKKELQFTK